MVDAIIENIYLINAPAGSGKTTKIRNMITNHILDNPKDNILCITYTNRAADELKKGLVTNKVYIGTIHSFLHSFIGVYFSSKKIIDLYFEVYGDEIRKRIENAASDANYTKSNDRYIEKFGSLSYETVRQNIKSVSYNETQFNSLYYGGLSHDDLILFAKIIFDKFPIIRKRLISKFQVIFIDEYQDSSAAVLKIFYDSVLGTKTRLYFLGDKMQQIYKNYDGTFENISTTLNKSIVLDINHRSVQPVIDILNNIYNNSEYKQKPSPKNADIKPDHAPRVVLCDDVGEKIKSEKQKYPDALLLYLLNQKRFETIGAGDLYRKLSRMDRYSFIQKNNAIDVLIDATSENPDPLIRLLFIIGQIEECFRNQTLGNIVQLLRNSSNLFKKDASVITKHEDKERLRELLQTIVDKYSDLDGKRDILSVVYAAIDSGLLREDFLDTVISKDEYIDVLAVNISEFRAVAKYLKIPDVSTQHGVKGESHDTVFFIAEDNKNQPVVHMYSFFKLWCNVEFSLGSFEEFYFDYMKWINETVAHLGFKLSEINAALHAESKEYLIERINRLLEYYKANSIFNFLCKPSYEKYLSNPSVGNAKECFKETLAYGPLCAYRLFYVGCSRARKNLSIFIDKANIAGFSDDLIKKFEMVGFVVE